MSEERARPPSRPRALEIDWLRAAAGALAAVASAFLLSFLGAAGTIIGAALGSLIVTVSSAAFAQGLSTSKRTLERAQAAAARKVGIAQAEVRRAERARDTTAQDSHLEHADERLGQARAELAAADPGPRLSWRARLGALGWKRILASAGVLFVAAIALITGLELVAGRSVSSITGGSGDGGTTIGQVGGRDSGSQDRRDPDDRVSPGPDGEGESSSSSPSDQQSPTDEPAPTDSADPSASPLQEPGQEPGQESSSVPAPPSGEVPAEPGPSTSPTP